MYPVLAIMLAVTPAAYSTEGYPPGLFENSPDTTNKKWTHLPDGRWMFIDPDKPVPDKPLVKDPKKDQWCDYEHQCYDSKGTPETKPEEKPAEIPVAPLPSSPPIATRQNDPPPIEMLPEPVDPYCMHIQNRLFHSMAEVAYAHMRCDNN